MKIRIIAVIAAMVIGLTSPAQITSKEYTTCQMKLAGHPDIKCDKKATKKVTLRNTSTGEQATVNLCDDHTKQVVEKFRSTCLKDKRVMSI